VSATLDRLAELMGIVPQFTDARGKCIRASDDTKRRLLSAMGMEVADEQQVCRHLEILERGEWLRPLPPVKLITAASRPPTAEVVLPADAREFSWRLALEDGSERTGKALFSALKLIAEREYEGRLLHRRLLPLPSEGVPDGYHKLTIEPGGAEMSLIMCPDRCYLPSELAKGNRLWGIAAQLYLLRSEENWGIGDFRDLNELVKIASVRGAGLIGLNPLHALFPDDPEHASPYSPASRLLLNVLNIDVPAVAEMSASRDAEEAMRSEAFGEDLNKLRALSLVDYSGVAALKLHVLKLCFESFSVGADNNARARLQMYRREHSGVLERNCVFLALREHFAALDPCQRDWHLWPEAYQNPSSPAVALFAKEQRQQVDFLAWLQWVAEEQLEQTAHTARACGMPIGLYRDLAVGADSAGAETWANRNAIVSGARVGAPPDIFNPKGQDWGLPPFHPQRLREEGYQSFVQLVRANMRHAGGLRVDHVMALQQLYWVPEGEKPEVGVCALSD
jgi:4-alpha-glucanotransferase